MVGIKLQKRMIKMIEYIEMFILLIFGHFLGDFVFQNQTMADKKNRKSDLQNKGYHNTQKDISDEIGKVLQIQTKDYFHKSYKMTWFYWMLTHGIVHGILVYFVVGNLWFGVIEVILHIIIDILKTEGKTTIHVDQLLHLITKVLYMIMIIYNIGGM